MKKNKMMRAASSLLVATMLTTSVISGTFAKYVTQDSATATARVAKWGVVASVSGDLFGATYNGYVKDDNQKEAATSNRITSYGKTSGTVSSMDTNGNGLPASMLVAPGTMNDNGMTLYVVGTPEVATKITYDSAEDENGVDYKNSDIYLNAGSYGIMVKYNGVVTAQNVNQYYVKDSSGNFTVAKDYKGGEFYELHDDVDFAEKYLPIKWTVETKVTKDGEPCKVVKNTVGEVESEVKTSITGEQGYAEYAPNVDNYQYANITWAWAHNNDETTDINKDNNTWADGEGENYDATEKTTEADKKDTILGNMIADSVSPTEEYTVVKLSSGANEKTYQTVKYQTVNADLGMTLAGAGGTYANDVVVAFTGEYSEANIVACLTVSFNARITVEQVD